MPGFAQGSRSTLSFIEEVTFGTTPAGNFTNLPFSTHSLNLTKERVQGNDIQSDRQVRTDRHGNRMADGDIVADLRSGDYDALLESLLFSTWDASPVAAPDELRPGTTAKYFSIEDYASDADQARVFTGCMMNSLNLSIAPNQMVAATFGVLGKDMTISATEVTQDAASGNAPFDAYSGDIQIADVGSLASIATITSVDFTISNNAVHTFVVGDDSAPCIEEGMFMVEGTITSYFEDASLINRFIDETESALQVTVNDPTGSSEYGFFFPRIKINGANVPVGGPESRLIELPFVALYDDTSGGEATTLIITRPDSS